MIVYLLVLTAAVLHAYWNYLAKTIPSGVPFVWLVGVVATVLMTPIIIGHAWLYGFQVDGLGWAVLFATAIIHLVYFLTLQNSYQVADLSVVYPLARGAGPVFSTIGAVLFLQETLSPVAIGGLGLVLMGVLLVAGLTNASWRSGRTKTGVVYGFVIGLMIATYTIVDSYSVKVLALSPLLIEFSSQPFRVVALSGKVRRQWPETIALWRDFKWKIIAISVMGPMGFIMVLYAFKLAPVHFVAPARELSIVFGVLLGGRLLSEENFRVRLLGSVLILAGIVMIGWTG